MKNFIFIKLLVILILSLSIVGCENNYVGGYKTDSAGFVEINGKTCQVISIDIGMRYLYHVDCPHSSSTTYQNGKSTVTVTSSKQDENKECNCKKNY